MTLDELKLVLEVLMECQPDVEDFSWGPTLDFAQKRRENVLALVNQEIKQFKKDM